MKKWIMFMSTATLAIGLSACGETAEPASGDESAKGEDSDLTAEEVYTKSVEASGEITGLHADIVTDQVMTMQPDGMVINMKVDSAMDMATDPLAFHQTAETSIVSEDIENTNPMNMEMYFAEEGLYMYEETMDTWLKMPDESIEDLKGLADQQTADPSQQLEELAEFQNDFTFEQTADEYILTLDASGEKFKELMDQQLEKTLGQMEIEAQMGLEDMTIHSVNYIINIDKETFLTNNMNMKMDMDMNIEGEPMNIKSDIQADYSEYNEIEAIAVPAEVIEQAQEIAG
ncbi:hypothetical protein FQV26_14795 [Planococcus sp. CPCC 101016]|uniref:DUF6612 family protein n=1 Tax=Planococcus sp. CPCC 101016 TaxID=2599617 RepID=UPI0011B3E1C9|nr:DUF6612 family protein [Planococcus sp. CPCC 101016]TWT04205.1 hypothetical protein FQV26_14795 [Planococcus sp. CPCC 101016]